jgi:hypothetical protein
MGAYEEEIMKAEIDKIYTPKIDGRQKTDLMEYLRNYVKDIEK